jgi:hypothetical protein
MHSNAVKSKQNALQVIRNERMAAANSVSQKKNQAMQGAMLIDNRAKSSVQLILKQFEKNSQTGQFKSILQTHGNIIIQRISVKEKENFEKNWEEVERHLDGMYEHDNTVTHPIVGPLEEIRSILGKRADMIDGDDLNSRIEAVKNWTMLGKAKRELGITGKSPVTKKVSGSSKMAEQILREKEIQRAKPLIGSLYKHIFIGEINETGDPTGFHSKQKASDAVVESFGSKTAVGGKGVYHQPVRIKDGGKEKGPGSTFFPDAMTEDDIRVAINMNAGYEVTEPKQYAGIMLEKKGNTIYPIS